VARAAWIPVDEPLFEAVADVAPKTGLVNPSVGVSSSGIGNPDKSVVDCCYEFSSLGIFLVADATHRSMNVLIDWLISNELVFWHQI
jgi:hypothetical protein